MKHTDYDYETDMLEPQYNMTERDWNNLFRIVKKEKKQQKPRKYSRNYDPIYFLI